MTATLNAPTETVETVVCPAPCVFSDVCPTYGGEFCPDDQALIDACSKC